MNEITIAKCRKKTEIKYELKIVIINENKLEDSQRWFQSEQCAMRAQASFHICNKVFDVFKVQRKNECLISIQTGICDTLRNLQKNISNFTSYLVFHIDCKPKQMQTWIDIDVNRHRFWLIVKKHAKSAWKLCE